MYSTLMSLVIYSTLDESDDLLNPEYGCVTGCFFMYIH